MKLDFAPRLRYNSAYGRNHYGGAMKREWVRPVVDRFGSFVEMTAQSGAIPPGKCVGEGDDTVLAPPPTCDDGGGGLLS